MSTMLSLVVILLSVLVSGMQMASAHYTDYYDGKIWTGGHVVYGFDPDKSFSDNYRSAISNADYQWDAITSSTFPGFVQTYTED